MMTADEAYGAVLDAVHARAPDDYVIAIPSYRRADRIGQRTLATLERLDVDRERVTIFAADDDEAGVYAGFLGKSWCVVPARPGLVACRQWYSHAYYPAGTPILNLDDDIDDLLARTDDDKVAPWEGTVDRLAAFGFGIASALGVGLWGLASSINGMYMHDEAVAGLRYVCGISYGSFAGDRAVQPDDVPEPDSGEDFLRTLRAFTGCGAVARLDWLGPKTVYFGPGGMSAALGGKERRDREHGSQLRGIALRYPELASVYKKADGTRNLRLKPVTSLRIPRVAMERAAG